MLFQKLKYLTGGNYIQVHRYYWKYAVCFNAFINITILFTGLRQPSKYNNHTYLHITKAGGARFTSKSEKRKKNKKRFKHVNKGVDKM